MPDIDAAPDESTSSSKRFFRRLADGDMGLPKTYWLYGVVVGTLFNLISRLVTSTGALIVLILVYAIYEMHVLFGTWRAASRYSGPTIWAFLAKVAVILGVIVLVVGLFGAMAQSFSGPPASPDVARAVQKPAKGPSAGISGAPPVYTPPTPTRPPRVVSASERGPNYDSPHNRRCRERLNDQTSRISDDVPLGKL